MLHYHGRKKALIKYENRHVYPAELETTAMDLFPDSIGAVCAVGVPDIMAQVTSFKNHSRNLS